MRSLLLLFWGIFMCSELFAKTLDDELVIADYHIVPLPQSIEKYGKSLPFILDENTKIVYPSSDSEMRDLAVFLSDYIRQSIGIELVISELDEGENKIVLKIADISKNKEAYEINISSAEIELKGSSYSGIFYAIQTLRKSIPVEVTSQIVLPSVSIFDAPQFSYRGALLDVSRHFFSVDFIKKYIDVLALYNMNVFHWHLTDDQGWRIEIKKYPILTQIGSKRSETALDRHSQMYDGKPYEGFYTQEEIRQVIEYASLRNITVIPEIDIPGHTLAVLSSYPKLGCVGHSYEVAKGWGIHKDVLCAGNDDVFLFLDDIFSEIAELFPSPYIHIGGDECLKDQWRDCMKCQLRAKTLDLKGSNKHSIGEQLQSYFIHRVEKLINDKGKKIIGWDEILEGGIAPSATIMSWRGTKGGIYATNKGHDVIMTPEEFVYLDYYQSLESDSEPYTYGWLTKLDKVYSFDPLPVGLPADKRKHILGGQVNVWTEYMPEEWNVEYMLLPRMAAFAETLWSYPQTKDYRNFVERMYRQSLLLDHLGYANCKDAYGVEAVYHCNELDGGLDVSLFTFDHSPIYYTLDGSEPSMKSLRYEGNFHINTSTTLKAVVFRNNLREKVYMQTFQFSKSSCRPVVLKNQPYGRYVSEGSQILTDAREGKKTTYRTGSWLGFLGNNMDALINLGEDMLVKGVSLNCFVNTRGGLFPPKAVRVEVSTDGIFFRTVCTKKYLFPQVHQNPQVMLVEANFETVRTSYIRVVLETDGVFPDWHEQKGQKSYLMVDEIKVL